MNDEYWGWNTYINEYIKKNVYNGCSSDKTSFSYEVMLVDVLDRTEEKGFVEDIISWLRRSAPRKVVGFLKGWQRFPKRSGQISYENLCESVYEFGFRADEIIERRMILGSSNRWTRLYFEEFPLAQ